MTLQKEFLLFKGSDLLDMEDEIKVRYCREKLEDSFNTNENFYGVQFLSKRVRKVVCNISLVVSVSRRNVSNNYLIT